MSLTPPSQDWMVLQCRACGTRMKSRRDVAPESRLLCPKCHTPVPLVEEGRPSSASGVEFRPEPLPQRQTPPPEATGESGGGFLPGRKASAVFQGDMISPAAPAQARDADGESLRSHPEFDGITPAEDFVFENDSAPQQGERRRRIKKRRTRRAKTYVELTDWNQSDLDSIPEAEITADIWSDVKPLPEDVYLSEENEYVVEAEEGEDGQTKLTKKKVRRKRLLAGARLFFKRFTWLSRHFTVALGILLAGVAVYGFSQLRNQYVAPPLPPVVEPPLDRRVLTDYDLKGAEKAVRDYLAADGVEAKLPFVRQAKRVKPLMEKWYKDHYAGPLTAGEIVPGLVDKKGGEIGSTGYFVMLGIPVNVPDPINPGATREEVTYFSVEEIRKDSTSTYLVDWETSTGYQEMPLETYKSTMPKEFHEFRVFMKPPKDDYYNHGFEEVDWKCVELYYPGRDFHLWGYVSRKSLDGRALVLKLENGWSGPLIAELQYPEDAVSRDQVIVRRMIHDSWYYPDEGVAKAADHVDSE